MKVYREYGNHFVFYYYGEEHLFINLNYYIKQGIDKNQLIYISMEQNIFEKFLYNLNKNGISDDSIVFKSVKELIETYNEKGLECFEKMINQLINECLQKGYTGIRFIGQPSFAIKQTSKKEFLDWEKILSKATSNKKFSILCIYDFYDYLYNKHLIDDKVFLESLTTHTHLLNDFELIPFN